MMSRRRQVLLILTFLAVAAPALAQDVSMVPVTVDGESIRLAMRIYKPTSATPAPTLVFNHGSTGRGTDPSIMVRPIDFPELARFFVERGWAVVMPARRGRGGSEGLYDEGFGTDRVAGYSCDPAYSIPGADRGLRDIDARHDRHPRHALRRPRPCRDRRSVAWRHPERRLRRPAS
jgi:pimeloyl-ACP methyl ester carboxylesterase